MLKPLCITIHSVSLRCVPVPRTPGHTLPCPKPLSPPWEEVVNPAWVKTHSLFSQYVNRSNKNVRLGSGNGLVKRSLKFVVVPSFVIRTIPAATASLDRW